MTETTIAELFHHADLEFCRLAGRMNLQAAAMIEGDLMRDAAADVRRIQEIVAAAVRALDDAAPLPDRKPEPRTPWLCRSRPRLSIVRP